MAPGKVGISLDSSKQKSRFIPYGIQPLVEYVRITEDARGNLLVQLYSYFSEKCYRDDGFTTFQAAYSCLQLYSGLKLKLSTVRGYFSLIRCYRKIGFAPEQTVRYPHNRLGMLKPFLERLNASEADLILRLDYTEFTRKLEQLSQEVDHGG